MSDDAIFCVMVVIWMVPFAVMAVRMLIAQRRYLRAYKLEHPAVELPENGDDPTDLFGNLKRAGNAINAYDEEQENPELEHLRKIVSQRTKEGLIWGFGCPVVFFIIATIFRF